LIEGQRAAVRAECAVPLSCCTVAISLTIIRLLNIFGNKKM